VAGINWLGILQPEDESLPAQPGGCANCHPGLGAKPHYPPTAADLDNVDCLICHAPDYKRTVVKDEDGKASFAPAEGVDILVAARNVQQPTREMCSRCHLGAAGGPNYKHGDYPTLPEVDVHVVVGLQCVDCHITQEHKIAGGGYMIAHELPEVEVVCTNCHTEEPHQSGAAALINKHLERVACQTCHIPFIARDPDYPTQMTRDYTQPTYNEAKGLYGPQIGKQNDVVPTYLWWDSHRMETPPKPIGSIRDSGAKITPWKPLTVTLAYDAETHTPIYIKQGVYKIKGDLTAAVNAGVEASGQEYSGEWEGETELMYFDVQHQVAPAAESLQCADCHSEGGRLDFAALGYDEGTALMLSTMVSAAPPGQGAEPGEGEPAGEMPPAGPPAVPAFPDYSLEDYQGPESCGLCHEDRMVLWANGPHAKAYSDPIFQESWEAQSKPKYCLACHTTGYVPNTGEYAMEGVTCEQCHAPYSEEHPPERSPVDRTGAVCGACHTVSYDEWHGSMHYQVGTDCLSCHQVCNLETHAPGEGISEEAASLGVVCVNCHHLVADEFVHTTHADAEVDCLSCHMQIGEDDIGPEGKIRTAHDFKVKPHACVECHAEAIHGGDQMISLRAELKAKEELIPSGIVEEAEGLRAEVSDLEKVATGQLWAGGTIGALAGLTMGAAAAWLWRRRVE